MTHKKHFIVAVIVILGLILYSSAVSAATPTEQEFHAAMMANPCAGCHGTDGRSTGEIPSLDNLSSEYIVSAMKAFKSGQRPGTVMNRIAKGYSNEEIVLMGKHFASVNKK